MFEEAFCVLRMHNELFFIFDRLCLITYVWSGEGKIVIFSQFW